MRWPKCCYPGCTKPSQVVYRRRERGPDGTMRSQRSRAFCGEHDHLLLKIWNDFWDLLTLKHPEVP